MYDEHASIDFTSLRRRLVKLIELSPGTFEDARTAVRCQDILDAWFGSLNRREHPSSIEPASGIARVELLDNLGNVVAAADFGSDAGALHWRFTPIITGLDIRSALERAEELVSVTYRSVSEISEWQLFNPTNSPYRPAPIIRRLDRSASGFRVHRPPWLLAAKKVR